MASPMRQAASFRSDVNLVMVPVTVTDENGHPATQLTADNFSILENKQPQQIRYFLQEDLPVSVTLILDTSQSMKPHFEEARAAAVEFIQASNPQDEFRLITFAERPHPQTGFMPPSDATAKTILAPLQAKGNTALWDTLYSALEGLGMAQHDRRAFLLISDGGDNRSRYTEHEIKQALAEADVQLYAIDILKPGPLSRDDRAGLLWLDDVTDITGGQVSVVHDGGEMAHAVDQISRLLRNQYVLGYYPPASMRDGKWHKLKVKVNSGGDQGKLHAYAKGGYYGPE
jgi:Ca-activated chloride channel family protein